MRVKAKGRSVTITFDNRRESAAVLRQFGATKSADYLDSLEDLATLPGMTAAPLTELPEPKIGDMATVLIPADERHYNDLWWWDGSKVMIADIHEDRYLVRTTDGYAAWLYRYMLVLANTEVQA